MPFSAVTSGLSAKRVSRVASGTTIVRSGARITEKPIQLRMVGNYHQFGAFVSGVASLPRVVILTMHDISLKPKDGKVITRGGPLELSGTVKTYRYLDEQEIAAQEQAVQGEAKQGGAQ